MACVLQMVEYHVAEKMVEAKTAAMDKLKPVIEKATSSPHYAAAIEKVTTAQVDRPISVSHSWGRLQRTPPLTWTRGMQLAGRGRVAVWPRDAFGVDPGAIAHSLHALSPNACTPQCVRRRR